MAVMFVPIRPSRKENIEEEEEELHLLSKMALDKIIEHQ